MPERTVGAPGSVAEPMGESQSHYEICQGSYGHAFRGLQVLCNGRAARDVSRAG